MRTVLTVRLLQAIAVVAGLALLFWSLGLPSSLRFAEAANLTNVSDTLSDSDPSVTSSHTILFTIPVGSTWVAGEDITIEFDTEGAADFDLGQIGVGDITAEINSASTVEANFASTTNTIAFDTDVTGNAGEVVEIVIPDGVITNPSATTSYEILISLANATTDTGRTRVAIIENVDVSASVDTTFTFVIAGVGGAQAVNGTSTTGTTTATAIPFGTLTANSPTTTAQDLTVTTNATQGYTVTVVADQDLLSSTGATIDGFVDGSNTNTPTTWTGPSPSLGNLNTYGHWGLTSTDATTTRSTEFGSDEWVAVSSTTPVVVMGNTGPADGTTAGVGTARVGYQVEISSFQEAGDDYSTTLTYVATPIF